MYEILYSIAIFSIISYIFYSWYNPKLVYVRSRVDKQIYVVRNSEDKQQAADLLANVSKRLHKLVSKMSEKYGKSHSGVSLLKQRFKGHEIRESLPKANQTSYSLNKGEKIVLCIRARNRTQTLTDINTITFVALHEMAHIMTVSIGHKKEFWENFRFILAHAIKWKIYTPVNYSASPKPYCGIKITDTPLKTNDISKYFQS
tara:strand:- start:915 stop:1520 length:606 start_codon:yes stop_codon:yes gene_type:complete